MMFELPICPECKSDHLVPLSDTLNEGGLLFKAWACINKKCRHVVRNDKGVVHWTNKEEGREQNRNR